MIPQELIHICKLSVGSFWAETSVSPLSHAASWNTPKLCSGMFCHNWASLLLQWLNPSASLGWRAPQSTLSFLPKPPTILVPP